MIKLNYKENKEFVEEFKDKVVSLLGDKNIAEINKLLKSDFKIESDFRDIILMNYSGIKKMVRDIEPFLYKFYNSPNDEKKKENFKKLWKDLYDSYGSIITSQSKKRNMNTRIVSYFNSTVCPYCNRDYISNRGDEATSAQLDHFFPRGEYPLFSVSLYNLVPVCSTCNRIKSTNKITISPHDSEYDFNRMRFSYFPLSSEYLTNKSEIKLEIQIVNDDGMSLENDENSIFTNIKKMKIDLAYANDSEYIWELIHKASVYTELHVNDLLSNYNGLFTNQNEILHILYGTAIEDKELGKRPLDKLTRDILRELDILQ